MKKQNALRWLGLIGAVILGGVTAARGDVNTGVGIIFAAFGSAGIIKPKSE